jgi:hypothetical protein
MSAVYIECDRRGRQSWAGLAARCWRAQQRKSRETSVDPCRSVYLAAGDPLAQSFFYHLSYDMFCSLAPLAVRDAHKCQTHVRVHPHPPPMCPDLTPTPLPCVDLSSDTAVDHLCTLQPLGTTSDVEQGLKKENKCILETCNSTSVCAVYQSHRRHHIYSVWSSQVKSSRCATNTPPLPLKQHADPFVIAE